MTHIIALVEAITEREMRKISDGDVLPTDAQRNMIAKLVIAEVLFRLATTNLLLPGDREGGITPDSEPTRSLEDLLGAATQFSTAYARTLRLAYEWAEEAVERSFRDLANS